MKCHLLGHKVQGIDEMMIMTMTSFSRRHGQNVELSPRSSFARAQISSHNVTDWDEYPSNIIAQLTQRVNSLREVRQTRNGCGGCTRYTSPACSRSLGNVSRGSPGAYCMAKRCNNLVSLSRSTSRRVRAEYGRANSSRCTASTACVRPDPSGVNLAKTKSSVDSISYS